MHVISNERALAHWQALNRLPDTALNFLKTRFLREQPLLASIVLPLTNSLIRDADGQERIPDSNDPKLDDFWRLTTTGAIMSEIFCREAGRPLRPLDEPDVAALVEESTNLFEQLNVADKTASASTPNLFRTCSQPNLFSGAAAAHFADQELEREELPREILTLRILVQGLHRACGDEPAASPRSWDAERIQFALSTQGDPLRREALAACDIFRAELAPNLIQELEWWAAEPEAALEVDGSLGMHALYLLARWRENPAWPVFRQLFSLPGDIGYDLLGDLITEDGSILLAMMGGQRREDLRAMVEDEKLDEYCRNTCLDALTCLVAWDELPRAEHIAYLRDLLTTILRGVPENEHVFGGVVSAVCDLEAWELEPEVGTAFTRGVVDEDFIDMGFFLDAKAGRYRSQWQVFCDRHRPITDVPVATAWMDEPPKDEPPFDDDMDAVVSSATPYVAPPKTGRNDPCPCGSGKKYKKCCGR